MSTFLSQPSPGSPGRYFVRLDGGRRTHTPWTLFNLKYLATALFSEPTEQDVVVTQKRDLPKGTGLWTLATLIESLPRKTYPIISYRQYLFHTRSKRAAAYLSAT